MFCFILSDFEEVREFFQVQTNMKYRKSTSDERKKIYIRMNVLLQEKNGKLRKGGKVYK